MARRDDDRTNRQGDEDWSRLERLKGKICLTAGSMAERQERLDRWDADRVLRESNPLHGINE